MINSQIYIQLRITLRRQFVDMITVARTTLCVKLLCDTGQRTRPSTYLPSTHLPPPKFNHSKPSIYFNFLPSAKTYLHKLLICACDELLYVVRIIGFGAVVECWVGHWGLVEQCVCLKKSGNQGFVTESASHRGLVSEATSHCTEGYVYTLSKWEARRRLEVMGVLTA